MKIYGEELRGVALRGVALRALDAGQRRSEIAQTLGVSIPTLDRWRRELRQSGQRASRPRGHKKSAFSPEDLPRLKAQVQAAPDSTLLEHLACWQKHSGPSASYSSLRRALVKLGWSCKKRVFEPVSKTLTNV